MGGAAAIATVFSSVLGTAMGSGGRESGPSQAELAAQERKRREEEQRKAEADERRKERERKREAALIEDKRLRAATKRSTLLARAGTPSTESAADGLKTKLGE